MRRLSCAADEPVSESRFGEIPKPTVQSGREKHLLKPFKGLRDFFAEPFFGFDLCSLSRLFMLFLYEKIIERSVLYEYKKQH